MFCRLFTMVFFIGILSSAQDTTELNYKDPKKAFIFSLVPGMGQIYNGKIMKSTLIIGLEVASFTFWQDNLKKYNDYDDNSYPLQKHRYLEKRNKYAWWIGIIYVYAMIDAVVDAHLHSFKEIMGGPIEQDIYREYEYEK